MKINRKLLLVLVLASLAPAVYFRIVEWRAGIYGTTYDFIESLLFNAVISLVVTLSISWVILSILHLLNQKVPWTDNILKRLFIEIFTTFPVGMLLGYLFGNLAYLINPITQQSYNDFIFNFLAISSIMTLVLVAISDWFYFFERWKESLLENQKALTDNALLQKENIIAKYEVLKNQINPHFLFNSLNVLSSLIPTEPDKAEDFTDELANLYRYILEQYEKEMVTLAEEIEISRSYIFLQKIRFSKGIDFKINISQDQMDTFYLFPLSVQTLLENAIKHNSLSKESPLKIDISLKAEELLITNNLQRREGGSSSTGIGLQNLKMRYKSYDLVPRFEMSATDYICRLPLLRKGMITQNLKYK